MAIATGTVVKTVFAVVIVGGLATFVLLDDQGEPVQQDPPAQNEEPPPLPPCTFTLQKTTIDVAEMYVAAAVMLEGAPEGTEVTIELTKDGEPVKQVTGTVGEDGVVHFPDLFGRSGNHQWGVSVVSIATDGCVPPDILEGDAIAFGRYDPAPPEDGGGKDPQGL